MLILQQNGLDSSWSPIFPPLRKLRPREDIVMYGLGKAACEWGQAVATAGAEHGCPSLWLPPYNPISPVTCVNMGVTVQQETQSQERFLKRSPSTERTE